MLPLLASLTRYAGGLNYADSRILFSGFGLLTLLFFALSWVLLQGAGVALRRIRLIMRGPLVALWETIGHCGNPPRDHSVRFAAVAIMLTGVAWFVVPAAAAAVFFL